MENSGLLVDTGPLVALLSGRDQNHRRCEEVIDRQSSPLLTTWIVMAEAAWLLRDEPNGLDRLLELVEQKVVSCLNLDDQAAAWIRTYASKYADLQPQLADLSLVYLAEVYKSNRVFTLDRRDFLVFRNAAGQGFEIIP